MSRLLLDDKPLIILPSLAAKIGLNESIILQQLHYWLQESKNIKDDFKWVYNTYEDWKKQFPFWSVSTIRRTITKLENNKLVIIGNYNKLKIDNTKWYRIDYELLDSMSRPPVQNEQTECSKWADGEPNMNRPLPEITTENTTDIKTTTTSSENPIHFYEKNLGMLSPIQMEELWDWSDQFNGETEVLIKAMKIALDRNKKNMGFVKYLLKDWQNKGAKSISDVEALETEWNNKGGATSGKPKESYLDNLF